MIWASGIIAPCSLLFAQTGPGYRQHWGPTKQRTYDSNQLPASCVKQKYNRESAAECRAALQAIGQSYNSTRINAFAERCQSRQTNYRRFCYALAVIRETQGDTAAARQLVRESCDETEFDEGDRYAHGCRAMGRYYWTPLNLGLVFPLQIFPDNYAVNGLSLGIAWARNTTIRGAQISMLNSTRELMGFQIGLYVNFTEYGYGLQASTVNVAWDSFGGIQIAVLGNYTIKSGSGLQLSALMNFAGEDFFGLQISALNLAERLDGVQAGLVNFGLHSNGAQLGLLNISGDLDGAAIGLVNIGADTRGLRAGLVNYGIADVRPSGFFSGLSIGLVNHDHHSMKGVSIGGYNYARDVHGLQLGAVNASKTMRGLSIGLVNYTEKARGVQIGLVNIIRQGPVPVMLLVNADFDDLSSAEFRDRQRRAF